MKNVLLLSGLLLCTILAGQTNRAELQKVLEDRHGAIFSVLPATGQVRFIQFQEALPLNLSGASTEERAWDFLTHYGELWAMNTPVEDLVYTGTTTDMAGNEHLRFRQTHEGIPVFDGELRLHFDRRGALKAVSGQALDTRNLPVVAQWPPAQAIEEAKASLRKQENRDYTPEAAPELMVFQQGLAQGVNGPTRLVYELLLNDGVADRQYVYVDAQTGAMVEQLPANCSALDREVYNGNTSGTPVWSEGDAYPGSLNAAQQTLVAVAEQTYYFFDHAFGFDSFDGSGSTMKSVADATNVDCPNATWNGTSTNFCTGFAIDDIVGHEWGHAYTEYTSNLIYVWQSGAINEAYSDIWGETIDLLNNYDLDANEGVLRTACNSSPRWEVGEGRGNALRDMWQPSCDGDPNTVTASNYWCSTGDNGGVHINSGIPNHAYALLVDGGSFGGETVTGLGFTKAAHIFWQAQSQYLSRTSDFIVLAAALQAACTDLVGVNLPALGFTAVDPGLSGEMISAADCAEVDDAIAAVDMDQTPDCGFELLLDQSTPDICPLNDLEIFYSTDFESGSAGWTATEIPTNPGTWNARNWGLNSSLPDSRAGQAMYGPDPIFGDCDTDLDNGIIQLESPAIAIPMTFTAPLYLSFAHYVSMELRWDGGIVQYQVDGGSWVDVVSADFTFNPYNISLRTVGDGNDNPLAGKASFTGADEGTVQCTWGVSQIEIGNQAGKTVRFRWQLGVDGCNGWDGWYLDDIVVGGCSSAILPVRWAAFAVKEDQQRALLEWTTAQEENNTGFWIERTTDPKEGFVSLGWQPGQGTTTEATSYTYKDATVRPGFTYYYRLRQVDVDGEESVSPLRSFRLSAAGEGGFVVYPNPVQSTAQLQWLGDPLTEVDVLLFDARGERVGTPVFRSALGAGERVALELAELPTGVYFVVLRSGEAVFWEVLVRG